MGPAGRLGFLWVVQDREPHSSCVVGHGDDFSTSLQFLHAVQWCRPSRRSAPHRQPGAVDRPAASSADIRRRQLRQLPARSDRAVAGRGGAVLPAVLRRGGDAAGGQEEAVRQERGAAGRRALPRRRVRCRQDPLVGVDLLLDFCRIGGYSARSDGVRDFRRAHAAGRCVRLRRMHRPAGRLRGGVHRRVRTGRPREHHPDFATALAAGRTRSLDRGHVEHAARTAGRGPVRGTGFPA